MDIIISRLNSPVNLITRRSYHENKTENHRGYFPNAGSDGCNLQRGRQCECHERRMGHHAGRDTVALNLTETHKTVQNIKARGAFTVSIADAAHMVEADYFGVESGNKVFDKFARSGLTASKAEAVDAPVINEFPICLECKFIEYQNNEYGCGVIGKVVNVTADESVMVDGRIDMSKVNAIAFDPYTHGYYKVTERVGEAFRDGLKLKK